MASLSSSRVVRPGELAERLGVSRVTLWRWQREGRLPQKRRDRAERRRLAGRPRSTSGSRRRTVTAQAASQDAERR